MPLYRGKSLKISLITVCLSMNVALPVIQTAQAAGPQVGVILPDIMSSPRWEMYDRPLISSALTGAGVTFDIQNASGDRSKFKSIANNMFAEGVKVLIIVGLDSPSAAEVEATATSYQIPVIDYDRFTSGGSANYLVSFNPVDVGISIGQGIVSCLKSKNVVKPRVSYLNGSPTDPMAALFKRGYASVVGPYVQASGGILVADDSVSNWDSLYAQTIFEQQFTKAAGRLDAVVAANEGLGLAAVSVLAKNNLNGKVCVSGQDSSAAGLAAIATGDLSNTVYKSVKQEAAAVSALAVALVRGSVPVTNGVTTEAGNVSRQVPTLFVSPTLITKANVNIPVNEGFISASEICSIAGTTACAASGIGSQDAISFTSSVPTPTPTPIPTSSVIITPTPPLLIKKLGGGVVEFLGTTNDIAKQFQVSKPSIRASQAPSLNIYKGTVISTSLRTLPKNSNISATITINGAAVFLGVIKVSGTGIGSIPSISIGKSGTYLITLNSADGTKHFVKYVVKS